MCYQSCMYIQAVQLDTLEPDWPQHDCPISFGIAQQYSSTTLSFCVQKNSTNPNGVYLDQLGSSGIFAENTTEITHLEITGYRIKYSTVLWLLELQIRCGRKVQMQVHTVNSNS